MKLYMTHYNPIELYPPALNFIAYIGDNKKFDDAVIVRSTKDINKRRNIDAFEKNNIRINRTKGSLINEPFVIRIVKYFVFNLMTLLDLIRFKPTTILYYETLSCFSCIFYKKWINRKCKLLVHYHEYTSLQEFQNTSTYIKFLWNYEKQNFDIIDIISHTNSFRIHLFQNDYSNNKFNKFLIFPNYPPKIWYNSVSNDFSLLKDHRTRFVHVGALSTDFMYLKEICEWIVEKKNEMILDIYSNNLDKFAEQYILGLNTNTISIKKSVNYNELPFLLKKYDVGLILYKGAIPNHIYSAPNKLFEYLASGLDVWFPIELKGSHEYINKEFAPLVVDTNFLDKSSIDDSYNSFKSITSTSNKKRDIHYFSEEVYSILYNEIS